MTVSRAAHDRAALPVKNYTIARRPRGQSENRNMNRTITTLLVLVWGVFGGTEWAPAQSSLPQFGHVFIVMEENHAYSDIVGSASMPYLSSLITKYGLATNYIADSHPSVDNYFMLTVGKFEASNNDDWNCTTTTGVASDDNIARELINAGKTWKV